MDNSSPLRTPIKRARRLGASGEGTHHFWLQRVTAVALIPLSVWFIVALVSNLIGGDAASVAQWLKSPVTALTLGALLVALFMHARLGVQTIIEDYVKCEIRKIALLLLLNALILGFGAASLMAVVRLHFFGI
jgi:succinate dehydrogenase / fumarate reductase, membrane anchor subunit